jgi:nitrile hydratase accessory protein
VSDLVRDEVARMTGAAALPRDNGEIVFDAPWQGRAFGLAVVLTETLGGDWERFRHELIAAVDDDPDRPYYESWVSALEALVVDEGLATADDLRNLADARADPGRQA